MKTSQSACFRTFLSLHQYAQRSYLTVKWMVCVTSVAPSVGCLCGHLVVSHFGTSVPLYSKTCLCIFLWKNLPALNFTWWPPPESVEGTGYRRELVVSILSSVHLYPHVRSPNRCMCSIVVVTAMVWSFLCIQVILQTFFWYFMKVKYFLIWLGRFQDPHQCQSPLLYNFFFFLEKQTNKQKKIIEMSFLYVTTYESYTVLKQSSNYSGIFCPECVGPERGRSSTTWLFSNTVLSCRNLAVCEVNDWGACVGVVVFVGVWLIGWVILPIWLIQCYRSEIAESPVFFFCFYFKFTACNRLV